MTPIDKMMDDVKWKECPREESCGDLPFATHSGIWNFMRLDIRVYRLNTGQAIIHADDLSKIFGVETKEEFESLMRDIGYVPPITTFRE